MAPLTLAGMTEEQRNLRTRPMAREEKQSPPGVAMQGLQAGDIAVALVVCSYGGVPYAHCARLLIHTRMKAPPTRTGMQGLSKRCKPRKRVVCGAKWVWSGHSMVLASVSFWGYLFNPPDGRASLTAARLTSTMNLCTCALACDRSRGHAERG